MRALLIVAALIAGHHHHHPQPKVRVVGWDSPAPIAESRIEIYRSPRELEEHLEAEGVHERVGIGSTAEVPFT